MYIDTRNPVTNIPSTSRGLADENKKKLTEWKQFETSVLERRLFLLFLYNFAVFQTFRHCRINTIYVHCRKLNIKFIYTRCETENKSHQRLTFPTRGVS